MKRKNLYFVQLMLLFAVFAFSGKCALKCMAWEGMEMPPLHIEGRYLVDDKGNRILLHGFGQTYSPWFNEEGRKWNNYDVSACLKYNKAKGTCANPLLQRATIKTPLKSDELKNFEPIYINKVYEYDIDTKAGSRIVFSA